MSKTNLAAAPDQGLLWFVAHTLPRREKKLLLYCERAGLPATLPCYPVVHKYSGKNVVFRKPLASNAHAASR